MSGGRALACTFARQLGVHFCTPADGHSVLQKSGVVQNLACRNARQMACRNARHVENLYLACIFARQLARIFARQLFGLAGFFGVRFCTPVWGWRAEMHASGRAAEGVWRAGVRGPHGYPMSLQKTSQWTLLESPNGASNLELICHTMCSVSE